MDPLKEDLNYQIKAFLDVFALVSSVIGKGSCLNNTTQY